MSDTRNNPDAPGDDAGVRDDNDLFERLRRWFREATDHRHQWRLDADADAAFVAGHQWSEEDARILEDQGRPAITFNRIGPFIDGVSGLEIGNRQEQRIIPRTLTATGPSELLTAAVKWVRDECDAEDEESQAFRDCVICGEGWTETRLDYDYDPDGMILIARVDYREVYPDPASQRGNYADARFVFRCKDVPIEQARTLAGYDADDSSHDDELDAGWARQQADEADDPHDAQEAKFYRNDQSGREGVERRTVRMVEAEWWEYRRAVRVLDPANGKLTRVTPEQAEQLRAAFKLTGVPFRSVADKQRVYKKALLGSQVIHVSEGNERGGFSLKAITGKRDEKRRCYYGLVRAMRDPQQWANKWLAQVLHIINTQAKGGIIAEKGAFDNPTEAQDKWTDPAAIVFVNDGAIRQQMIMPKPQAQFPAGIQQLMEFAVSSIPGTTGVSPEMMGQVDRTQPGVLEMQRKQQGMVLLSDLFNALRRYRKEQGRLLVWLITTFISDGRLIRIAGPDEARYISLVRQPDEMEYDVIVDDTPSSPNMKERTWGALMQMAPLLKGLPPQAMLEMLKFSPLPDTLISKLTSMMPPPQQGPSPIEQAKVAADQAKAQNLQADAAHKMAEVQALPARIGLEQQRAQAEIELIKAQAINQIQNAGAAVNAQALDADRAALEALLDGHAAGLAQAQQAHDQTMDIHQAMQPPAPPGAPNTAQ